MLSHERNIPHVNIKQEVSLLYGGESSESPNHMVRDNTHSSH